MSNKVKEIYLAGGCFWGVEFFLDNINGVCETAVGYANGSVKNPTYEQVCNENTGHAECVYVKYNSSIIKLEDLIDEFFKIIDPTSFNKQGEDTGTQYRTGIYYLNEEDKNKALFKIEQYSPKYKKPILVEVQPLRSFYKAEEYHQKYLEKNPNGYCHIDFNKIK